MFYYSVKPGTKALNALVISLAASIISILLLYSGWTTGIESKTWDWRVNFFAKPGKATERVAVILLDQNSLDWASTENAWPWPWPRVAYGAILEYLNRGGAAAAALDVLFTEPSSYGPDDDMALVAGCESFGRAVGAAGLGSEGNTLKWPQKSKQAAIEITGPSSNDIKTKLSRKAATFPHEDLAGGFKLTANVDQNPDSDGIYRRVEPIKFFDSRPMPLLGFSAFIASLDKEIDIKAENNHLEVAGHLIPIDDNGKTILRFRGKSGTHKTYSAAAVIRSEIQIRNGEKPQLDPSVFKDKYVFFGFSAKGLFDNKPVPVSEAYPGVEVNATFLDNLLSDDFIKSTPRYFDVVFILAMILSCAFTLTFFKSPVKSLILAMVFSTIPGGLALAAYEAGYWTQFVIPEIAVVITVTLSLVVNFATEGVHKQFIKNAFQQYLNPAVIEQILQNPDKLKLGGEKRELSIFFSDVQGFTTISESLDPEALTALLNDYLSAMTDIIHEEGGTVDKYEGDAIIAFWNAPLDVPDHAFRAVNAALRCQKRLAELRPLYKQRTGKDLYMRVGLNTGFAVVGNMGSKDRFDYTMLGDSVNLAARLEGVNKEFGTYTMVSAETMKKAGDAFGFRELGRVAVVGKKEAVVIFEPMEKPEFEKKSNIIDIFLQGLDKYYSGDFASAVSIFSGIKDTDPPASKYIVKCEELKESAISESDWSGVWVMTSK